MRTKRNNRKLLLRSLTCTLLLLCMMLTMVSVFAEDAAGSAATVDVVVLLEDVGAGKKITKKQLEVKTIKNVNAPTNAVSTVDEIVGMYAKTQLYAGEFVYKTQLTEDAEDAGEVNSDLLYQPIVRSTDNFVCVTDYFPANAGKDVAALIQEIIDENPQKTIYFPDGEYLISRPIVTSCNGDKSNSLYFSDGAILRADKANWKSISATAASGSKIDGDTYVGTYTVNALVALGAGKDAINNNRKNGSYFFIMGGIFDGAGVADGVCLAQGRETIARNLYITNFKKIGLDIPYGTNGISSDADVEDVTIVSNGSLNTVGLNVHGYDNTISNVNIYDCERGADISGGGNVLHNVNAYYTYADKLETLTKVHNITIGINSTCGGNFIFQCYVENYATGIKTSGTTVLDSCKVAWTVESASGTQLAYKRTSSDKMSACAAYFYNATGSSYTDSATGNTIEAPILNDSLCSNKGYKNATKFSQAVVPVK